MVAGTGQGPVPDTLSRQPPAMATTYRGRFAPSPTGPLHFGSLIAALVSYLDARASGGHWLVRVEDLDPPREMPGADAIILRQLLDHGLQWDGEVLYQSTRLARYEEVMAVLLARGVAYYCDCSRAAVQAAGGVYDGHCRKRRDLGPEGTAVRVWVPAAAEEVFADLFQGRQVHRPGLETGDYVVRRRDGLHAYQLAVVVDDWDQGISHVVRGLDLLDSTPRQLWLQSVLGAPHPVYGHLPVATNTLGQKLSKQNHAPSLDARPAEDNLRQAIAWLGMPPAPQLATPEQLLSHALGHWRRALLAGRRALLAPPGRG